MSWAGRAAIEPANPWVIGTSRSMKDVAVGDHDDSHALAKPTSNKSRNWMAMTDDNNRSDIFYLTSSL